MHPWVKHIVDGERMVLLAIIEGNALLQVCLGLSKLPLKEYVRPPRLVGKEKKCRVLHALSQTQELLPQLICRPGLSSQPIKSIEPAQHRKKQRRFPHISTQLSC